MHKCRLYASNPTFASTCFNLLQPACFAFASSHVHAVEACRGSRNVVEHNQSLGLIQHALCIRMGGCFRRISPIEGTGRSCGKGEQSVDHVKNDVMEGTVTLRTSRISIQPFSIICLRPSKYCSRVVRSRHAVVRCKDDIIAIWVVFALWNVPFLGHMCMNLGV